MNLISRLCYLCVRILRFVLIISAALISCDMYTEFIFPRKCSSAFGTSERSFPRMYTLMTHEIRSVGKLPIALITFVRFFPRVFSTMFIQVARVRELLIAKITTQETTHLLNACRTTIIDARFRYR